MKKYNIDNTPELFKIVELVSGQNPLQKKRINAFFAKQSYEYFDFAENLSYILNSNFMITLDERIQAASYYNKMCRDFLSAQIQFKKSGIYPVTDAKVARSDVYDDLEVMEYYMIGLLLSYMFWPNHYELFRFFLNNLPQTNISEYLEIGVGHGLFTSTMQKKYPDIDTTLIDISETSIKTSKNVLKAFDVKSEKLHYIHGDFLDIPTDNLQFDFVIMGEVLEHVNNGLQFMKKIKKLLKPNGAVYMSTAANSPALDHVLHFHNIDEIRTMMSEAGLRIELELALPSENINEERWEEELVTVNYCAILRHK